MEWAYLVGLGISIATLIFGAIGLRSKARRDYTDQLERELDDCKRERRRLQVENEWLRERLMERGRDG